MIDTLMVICTTGIWKHLLRMAIVFSILFACVCVLSFLLTSAGGNFSSLAATITSGGAHTSARADSFPQAETAIAVAQPVPTARPYETTVIVPEVLQIPAASVVVPASKSSSVRRATSYRQSAVSLPPKHAKSDPVGPLTGLPGLP